MSLGVRAHSREYFLFRGVLVNEGSFYPKFLKRVTEKIARSAVNRSRANYVVSGFAEVCDENRRCALAARTGYRADSPFKGSHLFL